MWNSTSRGARRDEYEVGRPHPEELLGTIRDGFGDLRGTVVQSAVASLKAMIETVKDEASRANRFAIALSLAMVLTTIAADDVFHMFWAKQFERLVSASVGELEHAASAVGVWLKRK